MFPYRDENPTVLTPTSPYGIIAFNVLAWLFVQGLGMTEPLVRSVCELGLVPGELLRDGAAGQRHGARARLVLRRSMPEPQLLHRWSRRCSCTAGGFTSSAT